MGLNQITLQIPLIKLGDDDLDILIRKIIKDDPELLEKFVFHPKIKPVFIKYIQEHQKSPSNKQENSEQKRPEPTAMERAILSQSVGGRERLKKEWGIGI